MTTQAEREKRDIKIIIKMKTKNNEKPHRDAANTDAMN